MSQDIHFYYRRLWIICPHPLPSTLTAVISCVQDRPGHAWQSGNGCCCCSRVTQPAQTTLGGGSRRMNVSIRCHFYVNILAEEAGGFAICKCLFKNKQMQTKTSYAACYIVEAWSLMFCPPHAVRDVFNLFNFLNIYHVNPSLSVFPSYCCQPRVIEGTLLQMVVACSALLHLSMYLYTKKVTMERN